MSKYLGLTLIVLLTFQISPLSYAYQVTGRSGMNNPLRRVCMISTGGVLIAVDDVPFCQYGNAFIGAEALLQLNDSHLQSLATYNYLNASDEGCTGNLLTGKFVSDEGVESSFTYCKFADGSAIENNTLLRGPRSDQNSLLTQVLTRY